MADDDPTADGTDHAHPAWWRGHDHTFEMMCAEANAILDGTEPQGVCREPWEPLRQRLWRLRAPTGADVMEDAWAIIGESISYLDTSEGRKLAARIARAIEQSALAAREQALEEAAQMAASYFATGNQSDAAKRIRALGQQKPG